MVTFKGGWGKLYYTQHIFQNLLDYEDKGNIKSVRSMYAFRALINHLFYKTFYEKLKKIAKKFNHFFI